MKRIMLAILAVLMLLPLIACGKSGGASWKDFTAGGVTLTLNEKCADALKALEGSRSRITATPSCGDAKKDGEDVVYEYQNLGFRLNTYREKENDPNELLRSIEIYTDNAKTPEGITIGSSEEAARTAYGTPTREKDSVLTYAGKKAELQLKIEGGKVKQICYFSTVKA